MTADGRDDGFVVKFSGEKVSLASGVTREDKTGLPRFALLIPKNVPYEHTMLYRDAMLSSRGAKNHGARNADMGRTVEDLESFQESAARHFFKWLNGLGKEDEAAASRWNIGKYEESKWRMENGLWSPDD